MSSRPAAPLSAEPWERQPGESLPAYAAFRCYLELGAARSLDRVGRKLYPTRRRPGKARRKRGKTGRLESWSSRWRWVERTLAYEDHRSRAEWRALDQELERDARDRAEFQVECPAR